MTNHPKMRTFVRLLRYRQRHTLMSNDFIAPIARPSRRLTSASHDAYVNILARHRQRINSSFQDVSECKDLSFGPGDTQPQWFRFLVQCLEGLSESFAPNVILKDLKDIVPANGTNNSQGLCKIVTRS